MISMDSGFQDWIICNDLLCNNINENRNGHRKVPDLIKFQLQFLILKAAP